MVSIVDAQHLQELHRAWEVDRKSSLQHPRQVEDIRDGPHQMIFRNDLLEIEAIEKLPLVPIEPPHDRSAPADVQRRGDRITVRRKTQTTSATNRPTTDSCTAT